MSDSCGQFGQLGALQIEKDAGAGVDIPVFLSFNCPNHPKPSVANNIPKQKHKDSSDSSDSFFTVVLVCVRACA
ncbi:hypothetical protein JCM17846_18380 [Iodidimonas nitroreducens]|uniref:Uncharacterized protein n=1 Tax=Iodidimonas nitroreducens TaxID=1236968 RepID=A0A5A7NB37_9PROT|nr:hypothetical protein JCM17846_18380 [Iodidimonas nitroreducens]